MINYLIELSAIHMIMVAGYWIFLRKEQQFAFMRFHLIMFSSISLIIPLIKLPRFFSAGGNQLSDLPLESVMFDYSSLPASLSSANTLSAYSDEIILGIILLISAFFLFRFLKSISLLVRLKRNNRPHLDQGLNVHVVPNLNGSFSFFNSVFIDKKVANQQHEYKAIIEHEKAHVQLRHTYDLLFFELYRICFWWIPSAWFALNEIKKIHEYQADARVLQKTDIELYSSILIHSTLQMNGFSLISSFNRNFIIKRINAMKQKTKKIKAWKLGTISALSALLFVVFACTEEPNINDQQALGPNQLADIDNADEIYTVAEEPPVFEGGMEDFYKYVQKSITYPKEALENGAQGHVFVQYIVQKDGTISEIEIVRSTVTERFPDFGNECEQEVLRVMKNAPSFVPGMQGGRPEKVCMVMPISFVLNNGKQSVLEPDNARVEVATAKILGKDLKVEASFEKGMWSGAIFDEEGNPVPGANIILRGTTTGTVSDMQGNFLLKTETSNDLIISSVGYNTVRLNQNELGIKNR